MNGSDDVGGCTRYNKDCSGMRTGDITREVSSVPSYATAYAFTHTAGSKLPGSCLNPVYPSFQVPVNNTSRQPEHSLNPCGV